VADLSKTIYVFKTTHCTSGMASHDKKDSVLSSEHDTVFATERPFYNTLLYATKYVLN
jgi:hypothetical protein